MIQKILGPTFILLAQISCVPKLSEKVENIIPQEIKLQCRQQCAVYDTKSQSIVGYGMCVDTCVSSHGY